MHQQTPQTGDHDAIVATDDVGLTEGTHVRTLDGDRAVEDLSPGDRIITRDSGMVHVASIDTSVALVETIRVRAGSLGHDRPGRDTRLGARTRLNLRDWRAQALFGKSEARVPVSRLEDGEFIAREAPRPTRLYRLVFDKPQIVYADGLEIETT